MRNIIYTTLLLLTGLSVNAQESESKFLKLANTEFAQLRYAYAIPLYKKHIELNSQDAKAILQLAKCYQINNQYDSAIKYTQEANNLGANTATMLPELLANKSDYAAAVKAYAGNNAAITSSRVKGFSNASKYKQNEINYTLHYAAINTAFNEFAALSYNDGLVFESNRSEKIKGNNEFAWDGSAYSKLYFTSNKNTLPLDSAIKLKWVEKSFSVAIADLTKETSNDNNKILNKKFDFNNVSFNNNGVSYFSTDFNSKLNAGAICFSKDSTAYFTKNFTTATPLFTLKNTKDEQHLLEIWSAKLVGGKWTNFTKLALNQPNASYFHPALSADEKRLYFVSDQVGGKGGTDLYYVEKDANGNWGTAVNAGDKVNTAANELYPTIADGELYISSNGHEGLGGLDIYKVAIKNNVITSIDNLGAPVNSATDDMSYTKNGNKGYFVSNRYGTDDIFAFDYNPRKVKLNGRVRTSDGSKPVITVKFYTLEPKELVTSFTLDPNGNISFPVAPNKPYYIEAADVAGNMTSASVVSDKYAKINEEYIQNMNDLVINIPAKVAEVPMEHKKPTFNDLIDSLKSISKEYVMLRHEFDKTTLIKQDIAVYNKISSKISGLKKAKIVVVSAADCMGDADYNEKLSNRRADAIASKLKKLGKKNHFEALHLGENVLRQPCDLGLYDMESQKENRYTYVFIL